MAIALINPSRLSTVPASWPPEAQQFIRALIAEMETQNAHIRALETQVNALSRRR